MTPIEFMEHYNHNILDRIDVPAAIIAFSAVNFSVDPNSLVPSSKTML